MHARTHSWYYYNQQLAAFIENTEQVESCLATFMLVSQEFMDPTVHAQGTTAEL
jgi:hypothetical protein